MNLTPPPAVYSADDEAKTRRAIENAIAATYKKNQDVEIGATQRLIMTDTGDNKRKRGQLVNGVLVWTEITS
ncbi:hypothetical protein [Caulobacter sp. NIBR2454]|uniref:hypothetical protein n=1 Tax=Caulobacter sp. NIBR2454 TaxID=3015996 RepID=UPI0022B62657|nr:hypothetical protein [Caulobacter sp. NIBR2454]